MKFRTMYNANEKEKIMIYSSPSVMNSSSKTISENESKNNIDLFSTKA